MRRISRWSGQSMSSIRPLRLSRMPGSRSTTFCCGETMKTFFRTVGFVTLALGGIGVMNIMLVAISERTREIGIRMAVGARSDDVLLQFLTEAVLVCLIGGSIGIVLGITAGFIAPKLTGWNTVFTVSPIVVAFGCAFLTGVVFGFVPARKAARLDPVIALARE